MAGNKDISLLENILTWHEQEMTSSNIFDLVKKQEQIFTFLNSLIANKQNIRTLKGHLKDSYHSVFSKLFYIGRLINNRIASLAIYDPKTGLYNPRSFDVLLNSHLQVAIDTDSDLSELIYDIDDFKKINERYTYSVADRALVKIANIIQDHLKKPQQRDIPIEALQIIAKYAKKHKQLRTFQQAEDKIQEEYKYLFLRTEGLYTQQNQRLILEIIQKYVTKNANKQDIDEMLRKKEMKNNVTDFATLLNYEQAGRFGGEEIVVVFPQTSIDEAYLRADAIRQDIHDYFTRNKIANSHVVTVSGGIQSLREQQRYNAIQQGILSEEYEEPIAQRLFLSTNIALNIAKQLYKSKNRVLTFQQALESYSDLSRKNRRETHDKLGLSYQMLRKIRTKLKTKVND